MTIRLGVASLGVVVLTYLTSAGTVTVLMCLLGAMIAGHGYSSTERTSEIP